MRAYLGQQADDTPELSEIGGWLLVLADHLKKSIEEGDAPQPSSPQTHWEWHGRFPETAQLLGGWFSQDIVDEFTDHDAAVDDYAATSDPQRPPRGEAPRTARAPSGRG